MNSLQKYLRHQTVLFSTPLLILILAGVFVLYRQENDISGCDVISDLRRFDCYEKEINKTVKYKDPNAALDLVENAWRQHTLLTRIECHILTHFVGYAAYRRYGDLDGARAAVGQRGGIFCDGGYEHGIMSEYFQENREIPTTILMHRGCAYAANSEKLTYNCMHALGHALAFSQKNILTPLTYCNTIKEVRQRQYCGMGVFMEYMYANSSLLRGHTPQIVLASTMKDICQSLDSVWKENCYSFVAVTELNKTGGEYIDHLQQCVEIGDEDLQAACYSGTGTSIFFGESNSIEEIKNKCEKNIPEKFSPACIIGSVRIFLLYNPETKISFNDFCSSFPRIKDKQYCIKSLDDYHYH